MAAVKNIAVRGIRTSIPTGHVVGRVTPGEGGAELINIADLGNVLTGTGTVLPPGAATPLSPIASHTILANPTGSTAQPIATTLPNATAGITWTYGATSITVTLANDLLGVEGLSGTGLATRTATDTWTTRSLAAPAAGFTITNNDAVSGNPTFVLADDLAALEGLGSTGFAVRTASDTWAQRSLTAPAAGFTIANNDGVSGNPTFALADDLAALEAMSSTGLVARTASNTYAQRTLTAPAAGITVNNSDGVAGNPTLVLANDLAAVEGLGSTGFAVRTASDTWAQRSIAGTADKITVSNGDGVSGNPTITVAGTYVGQTSITTLGTIGTGTWNGSVIGVTYGGTGANLSATGGVNQFVAQASAGAAFTLLQPTYAHIGSGTTSATATGLTISGGAITGLTQLALRDTSAAFDVTVVATSAPILSAGRTLTIDMSNVAHTLDLGATSNTITFPSAASYTLAGLSIAQTFTALQTYTGNASFESVAADTTINIKSDFPINWQLNISNSNGRYHIRDVTNSKFPVVIYPNSTASYTLNATGHQFVGSIQTPTISTATLTGATTIPGSGQISSGGALGLGGATGLSVNGITSQLLQAVGTTGAASGVFARFGNDASGPAFRLGKSRGSVSTAGAVSSGDIIGVFNFAGDDGSTNGAISIEAARIQAFVDGAVSTGIVPGRLTFWTGNTGGTFAERLRLHSSGGLSLGNTTDPGVNNLSVTGTITGSTVRTSTAYTVATLPAAGTQGRRAYVTDALAPTFLGALTGGGAVVTPVFDNGTAWVSG